MGFGCIANMFASLAVQKKRLTNQPSSHLYEIQPKHLLIRERLLDAVACFNKDLCGIVAELAWEFEGPGRVSAYDVWA